MSTPLPACPNAPNCEFIAEIIRETLAQRQVANEVGAPAVENVVKVDLGIICGRDCPLYTLSTS